MQRNRRLESLVNQQAMGCYNHITFHDGLTIFHRSQQKDLTYIPNPTGLKFHADNSFIKLVQGPYNSGKSTICIQEIIRRTCAMPVWYNGRRRAKWAIVRNTTPELYSTTLQTWLTWCSDLGDIRARQKPLLTYEHTFNDGKGVVELELIFLALDREDQIKKIKSLEVTGCYINELSEVPQATLAHFKGRVNHRYPSRAFCNEAYWSGIIADTNPPDEDHWICKSFNLEARDTGYGNVREDRNSISETSYKLFTQPTGLIINEKDEPIKNAEGQYIANVECDNYTNMSPDYYVKLAENQQLGFIRVYCLGKYGTVESGKRVYPEYNDDLHSCHGLEAIQGEPLHLGWDFGLTPACIVAQFTPRGQFRILKEYFAVDMGIKTFAQSVVLPALARDFPYNKIGTSIGDPSGVKRDEIMDELSCLGELNTLGIETVGADTNDLEPRIGAVRYFLNLMIDGKPGFQLSREGCPNVRKDLIKDYHYKRLAIAGEERYREVPDKNMASHRQDCIQYLAMKFASHRILQEKAPKTVVDMWNPVMRMG